MGWHLKTTGLNRGSTCGFPKCGKLDCIICGSGELHLCFPLRKKKKKRGSRNWRIAWAAINKWGTLEVQVPEKHSPSEEEERFKVRIVSSMWKKLFFFKSFFLASTGWFFKMAEPLGYLSRCWSTTFYLGHPCRGWISERLIFYSLSYAFHTSVRFFLFDSFCP